MSISALTEADRAKLKNLVNEGIRVKQEIEDLNGGLRDTVKAVSEELQIPTKDLNEAIRAAFKGSFDDKRESVDTVEEILVIVGRR